MDTVEGEVGHHHPLEIGLLQEEDTAGNHYKSDIANKQFVHNIICFNIRNFHSIHHDKILVSPIFIGHSICNRLFFLDLLHQEDRD